MTGSGLSRASFAAIEDSEHLSQSILDILTTPVGSRVMRREYGSDLPFLLDAPMNGETVVDVFAATADALDRWEPRLRLQRVELVSAAPGAMVLQLSGQTAEGAVSREFSVGGLS